MVSRGTERLAAVTGRPVGSHAACALMLAAGADAIVSTPANAAFARHLPAGSHRAIAGAKHEMLQEADRYRAQLWAAFDAFMPG